MTYALFVLPDENVLVVDDHVLQEVLRARHVLRQQPLLVSHLFGLSLLRFDALLAKKRR